ncbi:uncharacterized protein [Ptychodera flava]|uniref:uncharacterized protein n=1 Tax=Ptychodera flava TaxID=63121 RepID=UPI003969DA2C
MSNTARHIVRQLKSKGVKVLAFDFDETILNIHTGGFWTRDPNLLLPHVRPSMVSLIQPGMESGLHVCVVTFSGQVSLIRHVLEQSLPKSCDISKILIRGSTSDWLPVEDIPDAGKLQHIASVVAELTVTYGVSIDPEEVFLLDDDNTNVDSAREFGHKAFLVTKAFSHDKLNDYIKQIQ